VFYAVTGIVYHYWCCANWGTFESENC